jgi:hypothetical protein
LSSPTETLPPVLVHTGCREARAGGLEGGAPLADSLSGYAAVAAVRMLAGYGEGEAAIPGESAHWGSLAGWLAHRPEAGWACVEATVPTLQVPRRRHFCRSDVRAGTNGGRAPANGRGRSGRPRDLETKSLLWQASGAGKALIRGHSLRHCRGDGDEAPMIHAQV